MKHTGTCCRIFAFNPRKSVQAVWGLLTPGNEFPESVIR
jgi:hypothetical protein